MAAPLYLSYDEDLDWLTLIEFGSVENGQPEERWRWVTGRFGYLLREPGGEEMGFKVLGFSRFDPEAPEMAELWRGPRFDVPALGLRGSTAGEILLAARTFLGGRSTTNRVYFDAAMHAEGEEAERLWRYCLQAGDPMAHYALGYTLHELGRYREAYRHLRAYTELVPADAWAWCWLGRAAEDMGEREEAASHYERAISLGGESTDAPELLVALLHRMEFRPPEPGERRSGDGGPAGSAQIRFLGEPPEVVVGSRMVLEDGLRRGGLVRFERREDGAAALRGVELGGGGIAYYVHPGSTPQRITLVRVDADRLDLSGGDAPPRT